MGGEFWARRVLQLSLSESAVRYALCSLSALHRMTSVSACTSPSSKASDLQSYSLEQYNLAVKCTQRLLVESSNGSEDKLIRGLVACALFVCYENFTGNSQTAQMHLRNGLRIIAKERNRQTRGLRIPKDIIQLFKRLDLQALTFGDSKSPYLDDAYTEPKELFAISPSNCRSIEDSMDIVLNLCRWLFHEAAVSDTCPVPPEHIKSAIAALEQGNSEQFPTAQNTRTKAQSQRPIALFKMYQIIMSIILATQIHRQETLHDHHLQKYKQALALGEGLLLQGQVSFCTAFFCFDIGLIFPLFWIATKCRDSATRWRAVELLRSMHHQEGTWKSANAAAVAEFVIGVEEEGLQPGAVSQEQIPEDSRVQLASQAADFQKGEISLSCLMKSSLGAGAGAWYTREVVIPCAPLRGPVLM